MKDLFAGCAVAVLLVGGLLTLASLLAWMGYGAIIIVPVVLAVMAFVLGVLMDDAEAIPVTVLFGMVAGLFIGWLMDNRWP